MSNEVLPRFPGISITEKWSPVHNTIVRQSATRLETRATYEAYPLFNITLKYELLRADRKPELQQMAGFFMRHRGMLDDFLYRDARDYQTENDQFGEGDGVTRTFRLWRTWGGSRMPVSAIKPAPVILVDDVVIPGGYSLDLNAGKITFDTAPGEGEVLSWSGEYYWRVRFAADQLDFEQILHRWWNAGKIELVTVKTL